MTDVIIADQTIVEGDAIGHDIIGMCQTLSELGYDAHVYMLNIALKELAI